MRARLALLALALAGPVAEAGVVTFTDVTNSAFVNPPRLRGVNCTIGDIDADGDLDLWVFNAGDIDDKLYRNDGIGHFDDITANRDAFGLRAWVTADGVTQVHELYCHSAHPSRLHFGLGANAAVDTLTLRWPLGPVETCHDVPADQVFRPVEGTVVPFPAAGMTLH